MKWFITLVLMVATCGSARAAEFLEGSVTSTLDGQSQPIRYFLPPNSTTPQPLLVLLHTWSGGYDQANYLQMLVEECAQRNWALVAPHFRGPNNRPEAGASDLAVRDVMDAVAWMKMQTSIDANRIYLTGASGGGHMSLILAGRHPDVWAGVSAWVPITDLAAWHAESVAKGQNYAKNIEALCGGVPGASDVVDEQYRLRSPLTHLPRAKGLAIDIQAGIHDGHTGSVPVSHSLRAFNLLATLNEQPGQALTAEQIASITATQTLPEALPSAPADASDEGRQHAILLRRAAGPVRLTLFEGGHEGDLKTAVRWLETQRRATVTP